MMDYLQNHCWCSKSCWTDSFYKCRHIVSFNCYEDHNKEDWKNIIDEKANSYINEKEFEAFKEVMSKHGDKEVPEEMFKRYSPNLKPEIIQWLNDNVEDRKDDECTKGWCVGNVEYRGTDNMGISVFFHRRKDAMKFIKTFSKWKKPVNYCQYFTDVRKKLNLETLKYEMR